MERRFLMGCASLLVLACEAHSRSGDQAGGAPAPEQPRPVPEAQQVGDAFVGVAERLAPSVVRITTRQAPAPEASPFEGTPLERFFRDMPGGPPSPEPRIGMGSGVVIDAQGHILTNEHVVAQARELRVTFADGKEVEASVVGTDPKTDLAVIRVQGTNTSPAPFGSSEATQVGQWVMAIGNPFGLDHSVTVGVLSAKGRYGLAPGALEDFLQTDASINPGNSGGPLVNLNGEVIGINTMIAGIGTGVGFAVSEAIARPIARQLIEHGKVTRPYLGIVMQPLTPSLRQAIGEKVPEKGAMVAQVQKGSPAEKAGIQPGDIVTGVGDEPTADSREVQQAVLDKKVGENLKVTLWREGEERTLELRTAELPEPSDDDEVREEPVKGRHSVGLSLRTLTPELAERLGIERGVRGVVVTGVRPDSPAVDAGLQAGDVLVSIDRQEVSNAAAAAALLAKRRPGGHLLRVQRGDTAMFVVLESGPSGS